MSAHPELLRFWKNTALNAVRAITIVGVCDRSNIKGAFIIHIPC
jgi:hypothetical protein